MILIDTNVLSAMMRVSVDPPVERWFDAQPLESIWTTTITIFEIRFGLALLAPGCRRDRLDEAFDRAIDEILGGRVLAFDRSAAESATTIAARQRQVGRPVEIRDLQIAGIATARKATLATGNTRHFADLGIVLVDPLAGLDFHFLHLGLEFAQLCGLQTTANGTSVRCLAGSSNQDRRLLRLEASSTPRRSQLCSFSCILSRRAAPNGRTERTMPRQTRKP